MYIYGAKSLWFCFPVLAHVFENSKKTQAYLRNYKRAQARIQGDESLHLSLLVTFQSLKDRVSYQCLPGCHLYRSLCQLAKVVNRHTQKAPGL